MSMTRSPSVVPSKVMIVASSGSLASCSLSFAIWLSSSAKTNRHSESLRMNAVSSAFVVG